MSTNNSGGFFSIKRRKWFPTKEELEAQERAKRNSQIIVGYEKLDKQYFDSVTQYTNIYNFFYHMYKELSTLKSMFDIEDVSEEEYVPKARNSPEYQDGMQSVVDYIIEKLAEKGLPGYLRNEIVIAQVLPRTKELVAYADIDEISTLIKEFEEKQKVLKKSFRRRIERIIEKYDLNNEDTKHVLKDNVGRIEARHETIGGHYTNMWNKYVSGMDRIPENR